MYTKTTYLSLQHLNIDMFSFYHYYSFSKVPHLDICLFFGKLT